MANPLLLQLFFISLLSPTISKTVVTHAQALCLEHEKALLLELKNQFVFTPSNSEKLVQWNQTNDCCSWKGVECDGAGHVISLQLDGEVILGGLNDSSSLFSLNYLEKLSLAHSYFDESEIPRGIHKLTNLTHLDLSNTGFSISNLTMLLRSLTRLREVCLDGIDLSVEGEEWCHVISSSLPNLTTLSMRGCRLSGPLCPSLFHLNSLSHLQLNGNNLSSEVPNFFANFSSLTNLSLRACSLKGHFPEKNFEVTTLENLDLSSNELLGGTIPRFLHATSFRTINLGGTNFSGFLPASISNLKQLSNLDLSNCTLSGPIPSTLSNLTEAEYIDLSFNFFTGPVSSLHFERLSKLLFIDLGYNSLTGSFPKSLFALPSLVSLVLSGNQFSGRVDEFPTMNTSSLSDIYLSNNRLEGPIPDSFFQLQSLQAPYLALGRIDLSDNLFSGTFQLDKILMVPSLEKLDLSGNKLSFLATGTYPSPNQQSNLYDLDFSNNRIAGELPGSIWEIANQTLRNLNLSSNMLVDLQRPRKVPTSLSLKFLDLNSNQLAGEIPSWIWEIGKGTLVFLNLSCNMLVGLQKPRKIPTSVSLEVLDLHSNQLRGELPLPPERSQYVDYSNNCFDSSIPNTGSFFAYYLEFLSVANNSLSGPLPTFICNCPNLQVLDFSVNNLSGSIPPCLFEKVKDLQVLNLGRNNMSGRVFDNFSTSCNLRTLDISCNNFVGAVPLSLENCTSLAVMNVGNNQMEDIFPCMLPSSLQVLVLRSNRFHGEVRCDKSWPYLQIIDIAYNNFDGFLNLLNLSSWQGMMLDSEAELAHSNLAVMTTYTSYYYRDEVVLTIKGLELKLVKIWPYFTSVDFSCNNFQGDVPHSIGELNGLYLLNLSHNALSGAIPESLGKLRQLGSLDLSMNQLTGEIPQEIAGLTFLQVMDLSYNKLVGRIPVGSQIQTFSGECFEGNIGLCGLPLNISCTEPSPPKHGRNVGSDREIEWDYVFAAAGYAVGLGSIAWVLLFCRSFRDKYFEKIEDVFEKIVDLCLHRRRGNGRRLVRILQARRQ